MLLALALIITSSTASSTSSSTASPKTQWAPTGPCAPLHARAVSSRETSAAARPCAGEQPATAAGQKDWSYASNNPLLNVDPDGRRGDQNSISDSVNVACGSSSERCSADLRSAVYQGEVRANGVAAIGTGAVMCLLAPGCREAALFAAKTSGTIGLMAYFAGLQGHRPDGTVIETVQNPVDSMLNSSLECGSRMSEGDWFNGSCAMTAATLALMAPRPSVSAPVFRAPRLAPSARIPNQFDFSWEVGARGLDARLQLESAWKSFDPSEYYDEALGLDRVAGLGVEPVQGVWHLKGGYLADRNARRAVGATKGGAVVRPMDGSSD